MSTAAVAPIRTDSDAAIDLLQQTITKSISERETLYNLVKAQLADLKINPDEDGATRTEAKLHAFGLLDSLLAGQEMAAERLAKTHLRRRAAENAENVQQTVALYLKSIKPNQNRNTSFEVTTSAPQVDEEIRRRFEESGCEVSDGELMVITDQVLKAGELQEDEKE